MRDHYDVVICGGGLSGLTLARQLSCEQPGLRVAVLEKTRRPLPEGAHKVGESTVELGSQYLERLGLGPYLLERHLIKFGLRFFPGGGELPIELRTEVGPINHPVVRSYQLDRGRFESDLRGMLDESESVDLLEGAAVRDVRIEPSGVSHQVVVRTGDGEKTIEARWVVDATGRAGFLRSRMKSKRGGNHEANAAWFRVQGRIDVTELSAAEARRFREVPEASSRWLSTVHLMGVGYWVWLIPLASGMTSVGIVTHNHVHGFDETRTLDRALAFIAKNEPVLGRALESAEILDFGCLKNYCHTVARCWHPDRWAMVGEAGAFADPLYSPGTDYIAMANGFTAELIREDFAGASPERLLLRSQELNAQYRALVNGAIALYRDAAEVYGHARAMATKVYWDDLIYWSYPCHFFLQKIYALSGAELEPFSAVGARFVEMSNRMQKVFQFWAKRGPADGGASPDGELLVVPSFPSMLVDAHLNLARRMGPAETLEYMRRQLALAEELFSEILLRVASELGPELGREMWAELGIAGWQAHLPAGRVAAEALDRRGRRRALSDLARDVERTLGPVEPRWPVAEAAALFHAPAPAVA